MSNLMNQINEVITDLQNNDADYKVILNTLIDCKEALEQPAQEPVAWTSTKALQNAKLLGAGDLWLEFDENYAMDAKEIGSKSKQIPLYTHPAPSWQGLTDDEILKFVPSIEEFKPEYGIMLSNEWNILDFAVAIEQALKEKNT